MVSISFASQCFLKGKIKKYGNNKNWVCFGSYKGVLIKTRWENL